MLTESLIFLRWDKKMIQKIIAVSSSIGVYLLVVTGSAFAQGDGPGISADNISSIAQTIAVIAAAVTIIADAIQRRYQNRLTNASTYKADADAAKTYEEVTQLTGERNKALIKRIDELEESIRTNQRNFAKKVAEQNLEFQRQIEEKNTQIATLIVEIEKRDVTIARLSEWAKRLVEQIDSLEAEPIPFCLEDDEDSNGNAQSTL